MERMFECELFLMLNVLNIGVVVWFLLVVGILIGKYLQEKGKGSGGRMEGIIFYCLNEKNEVIVRVVVDLVKELGISFV